MQNDGDDTTSKDDNLDTKNIDSVEADDLPSMDEQTKANVDEQNKGNEIEVKGKKKSKKEKKIQSKFAKNYRWPLIVLVTAFCISMMFGVLSEVALDGANIIISIVVILVFLVIAIITDMIGVAITSCDEKNLRAMAARKIRGAKEAIILQKNGDKVSSIFADILGDVCGILSGAAGASVASALITQNMSSFTGVVIASLVSAIIAALIIFGKALMKKYSMNHSEKIILIMGKIMSIFHISKKEKNTKNNKNNKNNDKNQIN